MKKIFAVLFFLLALNVNGQFYEKSFYTSSHYITGVAQNLTNSVDLVDRGGNIFQIYAEDICMGCYPDYYITKQDYYSGNSWSYRFLTTIPDITGMFPFEDQNGNTYFFWKTDVVPHAGYNLSGGYDYALFKYNQLNVLQWIIDVKKGTGVFYDVNDNISIIDSSLILRRYNSSGSLTDSVQYVTATAPSFMDSLGFFYRYSPGTITKFDINNNVMWQKNLPFVTVDYSMQGENIFAYSADSIFLIDLNGNHLAYYNFAQSQTGLRFDLNGFYYYNTSKFSFTGLVHQQYVTDFNFMDRTGRTYKFGYERFDAYSNGGYFNTVIPPSIIGSFGPYGNSPPYGFYFNWCQVYNPDETQRNIQFTINNSGQQNFCTSNPKFFYFNVSKYPPSLLTAGFDVELSDSSGNFSTPTIIGHGIGSPISVLVPTTTPSGNNYSIRVIPLDTTFTFTDNVIDSIKIHTSPTGKILFSDLVVDSANHIIAVCDSTLIGSVTDAINPTYQWSQYIQYQHPITIYYSNQSTVSTIPLIDFCHLNLKVTNSLGCYVNDSVLFKKVSPFYNYYLFPDTINISAPTLSFKPQLLSTINNADTAYGNFVQPLAGFTNTYTFNQALAGQGWHYIYSTIKPSNLIGDLPCMEESRIDSIFVATTGYAKIISLSKTQICIGDSLTVNLQFTGDPPFTFTLLQGSTSYGPYTTFGNNYSFVASPISSGTFLFVSFMDANGSYTSSAWQNGINVNVYNYAAPILTNNGNLSFCAGDSVQLIRNNQFNYFNYYWLKNGVNIAGVTGINYYAKTQGVYRAAFVSNYNPWCTFLSNPINVNVPCMPPATNSSKDALITDGGADNVLFLVEENFITLKHNPESVFLKAELYDMSGRQLQLSHFHISDSEVQFSLSGISPSIYIIKSTFTDGVIAKKFVVKR